MRQNSAVLFHRDVLNVSVSSKKRFTRIDFFLILGMEPRSERHCLHCAKTLKSDMRKDAKFCNDYCRTGYNNLRRSHLDPSIARIDKILHKNFELLVQALKGKEFVYVDRERLIRKGFNIDYYTQVHGDYRYCYTLCYQERADGKIKIAKGFDSIVRRFE